MSFQLCYITYDAPVTQRSLILLQRYNPDLQKRSLENRKERQEDFDKFVTNLKEYSKSDKPSKYICYIPMHFH